MNDRVKNALVSCNALAYGDFTLASGKKSEYYIDIKKASTDPYVLETIADEMAKSIAAAGLKFDLIGGVALGSVPLAVALSLRTKIPYIMVRKEKKDHGTQKLIEGTMTEGSKILMVEDVVTSAGSVSTAVDVVRNAGGIIENVFCVVDRQSGGSEPLREKGVELLSLITAEDVLKR